jgi:hypothetical protein
MEEHDLEKAIFKTVRNGQFTTRALFDQLKGKSLPVTEVTVRQVVWNLIDEGRLDLTVKGKLAER